MIRNLLLVGLMLGVAAAADADEACAVAVLDTARSVARTTPDPSFAPVGCKRYGVHRGSGRVHKSLRGSRFFAGRRLRPGPSISTRVIGPRFVPGGLLRPGDGSVRKGFVGPRLFPGKRFAGGGVVIRKGLVAPQRSLAVRFGDAVVARKGFVGPQLFLGKRFGDHGVVVRKGFGGPQLFLGARFGDGGVVVRKGFVDGRSDLEPSLRTDLFTRLTAELRAT